jgi:prepilin-type N-terminal cleavage/methylation domain-containing protein
MARETGRRKRDSLLLQAVSGARGFTLVEILIVVALIGILGAVAMSAISSYYGECCVKSVMFDLTGMVKEAKGKAAVDGQEYAIAFNPAEGKISLVADRGPDGSWNSGDDIVIRSVRLANKGGGLSFGHGTYDPPEGLVASVDGITFSGNTLVCNTKLTGSSGTVYIKSSSGAAMALTMNSEDFGYTLRRWDGGKWVKL